MKRQGGFSMVELMVAITLALLLTGGVVSVFIASRTAYQATSGVGEMSDSGRFALNLIGESVRSAGNVACNSAMTATSQNVIAAGFVTFADNFGQGVAGFEATNTGNPVGAFAVPAVPVAGAANNWAPNLDPIFVGAATLPGPPAGLAKPVQGSDVLVLRSSVPRIAPLYTTADVAPGAVALPVTLPVAAPLPMVGGQYAAVADCTKSVIFQVAGAAAGSVTLNNALPGVGFAAGALVTPLSTTVYYIGVGSDGDASLWRLEQVNGPGFAQPEELVPDVENMQVLYGIDPSGTQTASAYVTADQVGALNVVSIQVALLVASPPTAKQIPAAAPFTMLGNALTVPVDSRMRQVFYATINLRDAVN